MGNLSAIYVKKASNAEIWDEEGKRYINLAAGIAVTNTGHSHPDIVIEPEILQKGLTIVSEILNQLTQH